MSIVSYRYRVIATLVAIAMALGMFLLHIKHGEDRNFLRTPSGSVRRNPTSTSTPLVIERVLSDEVHIPSRPDREHQIPIARPGNENRAPWTRLPKGTRESLIAMRQDILKEKEGIFGYNNRHYGVTLGRGSIQFAPNYGPRDTPQPNISYRFTELRVGKEILATGAPVAPVAKPEERAVVYSRGVVEEQYLLGTESLEQTFVIKELPKHRGEITITGAVSANLKPPIDGTTAKRLAFEHEGIEAIFFSDAVVFDASGKSLPLDLTYSQGQVRITVPESWVAQAVAPIVIDPVVGSPFLIDDSVTFFSGRPPCDVAYNPAREEWLVVWNEQFGATSFDLDVYGRRVDPTGALLGSQLAIGTTSHGEYETTVSYAPNVDRYLVAWTADPIDDGSIEDQRIDGRVLNGDGTFYTSAFTIADPADLQDSPSSAFDGINWYVCFHSRDSSNSSILGRFLATDGTLGSSADPHTSTEIAGWPTVAFSNGIYMIVWGQGFPDQDVVARTMTPSGSFPGSITTVEADADSTTIPDVSAGNGRFLITWKAFPYPNTTRYIRGRIANTSMGFDTSAFTVKSSSSAIQSYPRAAYSSLNNEWLVVSIGFETGSGELYGTRISSTGSVSTSEQFTTGAASKWSPELAWNSNTNEMLIGYFQDTPAYKLYGIRYGMYNVAAPGNFLGTVQSSSSILWTWNDVASETGYDLHDVSHHLRGLADADVLSFLETGLPDNSLITRHVHAKDNVSLGPPSNSDSKYTYVHDPFTTDFTLGAISSTHILVSVVQPPNATVGQTACRIERSSDNVNWSELKAFATAGWFATDSGLTPATQYWYRVTYRNVDGAVTATSDSKSGFTPPPAPSNFTATPLTLTTIRWDWSDVTGETSYQLHDDAHSLLTSLSPAPKSLPDLNEK